MVWGINRRSASLLAAFSLVSSFSAVAHAGGTALKIMPVAYILKNREGILQWVASASKQNRRYVHSYAVEVGVADRVELGYDNDFGGNYIGNIKLNLMDGTKSCCGVKGLVVSCGLNNVQKGKSDPFLVVGYGLKNARVHATWMRSGSKNQAGFGVDTPILGDGALMLEHITGDSPYTWVGLTKPVPGIAGLNVGASFGFGSKSGSDTLHYVTMFYGFKF
jgi:hypothetical protein